MTQYGGYPAYRPPGSGRTGIIWVIVGLVLVAVASAFVWAVRVQATGPHFDKTSLCETKGPTSITVMLLDATDRISALQRTAIDNRLHTIVGHLKANERLDVYEIGPDQDLLKPVFSKCRPFAPEEVSELTGNKREAQDRFDHQFSAELKAKLEALMDRVPADRSPIMEAIQAASVKSLQAPDLRANAPGFSKQLVVVSDMLENGDAGSHYGSIPDFDAYRHSQQFARFKSNLKDVSVVILYLRRDDGQGVQGNGHIDFWDRWFSAQDATVEHVIPIEG
jgi:hypothetical protein